MNSQKSSRCSTSIANCMSGLPPGGRSLYFRYPNKERAMQRAAPKANGATGVALKDPKLFREQAYVDGIWADADGNAVLEVTNPATRELIGTVPRLGADEIRR